MSQEDHSIMIPMSHKKKEVNSERNTVPVVLSDSEGLTHS